MLFECEYLQLGLLRRRRGKRAGCRHSWRYAMDRNIGRPIPICIGRKSVQLKVGINLILNILGVYDQLISSLMPFFFFFL